MIKEAIKEGLRKIGFEIYRSKSDPNKKTRESIPKPPIIKPNWPLPRSSDGPSDEEICREFAKYNLWHYAYEFEGDLSFSARHNNPGPQTDAPERPLQRFRHFMPYLVEAQNGSLQGKRILDIACNSGFWSIQCALLGAEVVGFDARKELIDQANLIKSIVGIKNVDFRVLDFEDMNPQALGGTFDVVLNLGILYHLPSPLETLKRTKIMASSHILLDTCVARRNDPVICLRWEEPWDIRDASSAGITAYPSKSAMDLMLRHIDVAEWFEIPICTTDMPVDYLKHNRASWLIKV